MHYFIITGTSRGIGRALAQQLVASGEFVIGVSRSDPAESFKRSGQNGEYRHISCDLAAERSLDEALMEPAIGMIDHAKAETVTLVNNAGVAEPFGTIEQLQADAVAGHIHLNLTVPMLLSGAFLRRTAAFRIGRRIVNISSGAATTPYPGWAPYSSAKAALAMLTRVIAAENAYRESSLRVIGVTPGGVETAMQERIRGASAEEFPMREKFVRRKQEGRLHSPEQAARGVLRALTDPAVESGETVDIRKQYAEEAL